MNNILTIEEFVQAESKSFNQIKLEKYRAYIVGYGLGRWKARRVSWKKSLLAWDKLKGNKNG